MKHLADAFIQSDLQYIEVRASERSWAVRISAPRSRGCSLPRSTAQSWTRSLRSIPLPAHLQFHPAPEKSLHARSNLKLLCMPKTCRFQPKPYASDTLSAWQTWSGFVAWLLRKKSASLLFCRGAAVAAWLDHTWYARIPQAMWLLLTWVRKGKSTRCKHAPRRVRHAAYIL